MASASRRVITRRRDWIADMSDSFTQPARHANGFANSAEARRGAAPRVPDRHGRRRGWSRWRGHGLRASRAFRDGELDHELAALAGAGARHRDGPPVELDDPADQV